MAGDSSCVTIITQRITQFFLVVFCLFFILLASMCCDTAQALVFLLASMCCDTTKALLFLLASMCCDTVQALVFSLVSM